MNTTMEFVIRHGYAVLFFWILAEQSALPIPSVPLLLVCGALIRDGHMGWMPVILFGVLGCLIADGAWFQLSRIRGSRVLRFLCRMALEPDYCVQQTESRFVRYGVKLLLVSKFIPGVNALAIPMAGSSGASWAQFLLFGGVGSAVWITAWATVGNLFSSQLDEIAHTVARTGSQLVLLILVIVGGWIAFKYIQRRRFLKKISVARIAVEELHRMLTVGEEVVVIDVRGELAVPREPIPGALRIPLSEIAARQSEVPRDRDIVLFCACPNEASSGRAALILKKYGITRVRPLLGGSDAWLELVADSSRADAARAGNL